MTPADVLDAAADYIRTHGLAKGQFKLCDGRVCALGAIYEAADADMFTDQPYAAAEAALVRLVGWPPHWNDHPSRTADEVMDALMESAARWREEHEG